MSPFVPVVLSQANPLPVQGQWPMIGAALFAVAVFGVLITALRCYKRCPSNKILVKWGVGTGNKSAHLRPRRRVDRLPGLPVV